MNTSLPAIKKGSYIAIAAMGVLLIGVIIFFKNRILFADGAFVGFNTVNYKTALINNLRYGEYIPQGIPYLGEKLHLPITVIEFLFSTSFNVFYLLITILLVFGFREYKLAILMSMYYFLITSASYICTSDISVAIALMCLMYAILLAMGRKKVNVFLIAIPFLSLAFITVSTHFVVIIPTAFLWLYLILDKELWPFSIKNTLLLSALLVAIIAAKYLTVARSATYDAAHLQGVSNLSLKVILHALNTPVIKMFFYRCAINYWVLVIVFVLGIVSLLKSKKMLQALLTMATCLGYMILLGITYGAEDKFLLLFHIEGEWASMGIIAATPFVFDFLPKLKPSMVSYTLIGIFLVRLVYIGASLPAFTWRLQFQDQILAQMKKKNIMKLGLYKDPVIDKKYILDWATTYESMLSSAMKGEYPQRTFFFVNKDDKNNIQSVADPKVYFNVWNTVRYSDLNSRYFAIDTTQRYRFMSFEELFKD